MPKRHAAKKPARKKQAAKPTRKVRQAVPSDNLLLRTQYRYGFDAGVKRAKELEAKTVELALKITMQERTIARLLCLLNETPSEELKRANAEIVRVHDRLGTTKERP